MPHSLPVPNTSLSIDDRPLVDDVPRWQVRDRLIALSVALVDELATDDDVDVERLADLTAQYYALQAWLTRGDDDRRAR